MDEHKQSGEHTPGPWRADYVSTRYGWSIEVNRPDKSASIAVVDGMRGECQEANARLIATAPELLAALEAVQMIVYANFCPFGKVLALDKCDCNYHLAAAKGRAAIAKAKGVQS